MEEALVFGEFLFPADAEFGECCEELGGRGVVFLIIHDADGAGDGPVGVGLGEAFDGHSFFGGAFFEDAEIPAAVGGFADPFDDIGLFEPAGELEAGLAGLGDLEEQLFADAPGVTDANFFIGEASHGEVFAERAVG